MRKVIKILIASDVIHYAGFGLVAPIFAIFLKKREIKKIENHSFEKMAYFFAGRKKSYKENR